MKSLARILAAGALCASALFGQQAHASEETITVRGGFVNDPACAFATVGQTADPTTFALDCRGLNSIYTGGFTGQTTSHLKFTIDVYGNIEGTFDEWFYGRYMGDGTLGELHVRGTFSIDGATSGFVAEADIVDGTCGFVGSTGTATFDGHSLFGGYTFRWTRPTPPVTPDPTCNPVDPDSLPV